MRVNGPGSGSNSAGHLSSSCIPRKIKCHRHQIICFMHLMLVTNNRIPIFICPVFISPDLSSYCAQEMYWQLEWVVPTRQKKWALTPEHLWYQYCPIPLSWVWERAQIRLHGSDREGRLRDISFVVGCRRRPASSLPFTAAWSLPYVHEVMGSSPHIY